MLDSEKPGFLFRVNTLVKSLFSDKNENLPSNTSIDVLAEHNKSIISALQSGYYAFNVNEASEQGSAKKLPAGLSMNEQKQKIIQDILDAAMAQIDNEEIINLKHISEALAAQYLGTSYENLFNLMLNNDSHINFSHLMQSNQNFIESLPAQS